MDNSKFAWNFNKYQELMEEKSVVYNNLVNNYQQQLDMLGYLIDIYKYLSEVQMSEKLYEVLRSIVVNVLDAEECTVAMAVNRKLIVKASTNRKVGSVFSCEESSTNNLVEYMIRDNNIIGAIEIKTTIEQEYIEYTRQFLKLICTQLLLILANRELNESILMQANTDCLTGCYNRRAMCSMVKLRRLEEAKYCIFMLDIDFFKKVNDTYGHDAGDVVLKRFGEILKSNVRKDDIVCRYGGEEFVVYLHEIDSKKVAYGKAEEIRKIIEDTVVEYEGIEIRFTSSIGIGINTGNIDSIEEVIKIADTNLYKSKNSGRNKVTV